MRKLVRNQVEKIAKDRINNFVVSKKEHIFDVWRQMAERRAMALRKLAKNIRKNLM